LLPRLLGERAGTESRDLSRDPPFIGAASQPVPARDRSQLNHCHDPINHGSMLRLTTTPLKLKSRLVRRSRPELLRLAEGPRWPAMAVPVTLHAHATCFAGMTLRNTTIQRRLCFYRSMRRLGAVYEGL
jgi:hypothetical protein